MRNHFLSFIFVSISFISSVLFSQNEKDPVALGLPGDNLNLYAVLDIFQKSPTLEEFEKSINNKNTNINNLDLNNDKLVDYIKVIDYKEGNNHSIVLQVAIDAKENQDVAVIEIHKDKKDKILIQIIGDEDLYGKNYIVVPTIHKEVIGTPNPGYIEVENEVYYVNDWPIVVHLFSPLYTVYFSPWYWGFYPTYWAPWAPVYYYNYWGYHHHYYTNHYYSRLPDRRFYNNYYYQNSRRSTSQTVNQNRISGVFNGTYEGRVYRKPETPRTRTQNEVPINRNVSPSTRTTIPSSRSQRTNIPSTRQSKSNVPNTRTTPPSSTGRNENTRRR